jgi:hypothetical protein
VQDKNSAEPIREIINPYPIVQLKKTIEKFLFSRDNAAVLIDLEEDLHYYKI